MVEFTQTEKEINLKDINAIEEFIGLVFPNEYKEHLLKYNGGQCYPNVFKFIENDYKSDSMIDWFLAIYDGKDDNLKEYIKIYKIDQNRLPKHILPISHDPGGNLICISCGEKDYGFIYFWDHEKEDLDSDTNLPTLNNLYFVANSLNEFLNSLTEA
jgi:hypothetical protein